MKRQLKRLFKRVLCRLRGGHMWEAIRRSKEVRVYRCRRCFHRRTFHSCVLQGIPVYPAYPPPEMAPYLGNSLGNELGSDGKYGKRPWRNG